MTKKDFILIEDSIEEATEKFLHHLASAENLPDPTSSMEKHLRIIFANVFVKYLRYTSDNFDGKEFAKNVTRSRDVVKRLLDK